MVSAATYNRQVFGKIWTLQDLPQEYPGYRIILQGGPEHDSGGEPGEPDRIDWVAFSATVRDFQERQNIVPRDGKLGPVTLRRLREFYGAPRAPAAILQQLGDLVFHPATAPVCPPLGPPLAGRTPEEQSVCNLWNGYGAAIYRQAQTYGLPEATALAVFSVESGTAYDPQTGLVIIRFEPHIFRRQAGRQVSCSRGGQPHEWRNLARAYDLAPEAALLSTSYGLPQLMGFNWPVTRHPGVKAMVQAFQDSCEEQVAGFFAFVEQNGLGRYILKADWDNFSRRYNGPANLAVYSQRLRRALAAVNSLQDRGARFVA